MIGVTCIAWQLSRYSNVHVRVFFLHLVALAMVIANVVFLFFASIHCPSVMQVQEKVTMLICDH
jgi:hypothetical protein